MKLRKPTELHSDPNFHYMVGRLVGATEMLARYMQIHGDAQGKEMGQRVDALLGFFYDRSDESTMIIPPQKT